MRHQDADQTLRRDIISHFALRLVYCREYVFATIREFNIFPFEIREFYILPC
jgi:hypothetical protein